MNAGDAFLFVDRSVDGHLWVVVSDPPSDPDRVLLVSLCSATPENDNACRLDQGDHPWIRQPTTVYYGMTEVVSLSTLVLMLKNNEVEMQAPLSSEVLARIREGFRESRFARLDDERLLIDQDLID